MAYPVLVGPSDARVCVVAQDPNYSFFTPDAVALHDELVALANNRAPWEQVEDYLWRSRLLEPRNRLVLIRTRVAQAATLAVEQVYFTNLAKCGRRGAYETSGRGELLHRIEHCRAYLVDELALAGLHTTIVFGPLAAEAVSSIFDIKTPHPTPEGEFRDVGERHLVFFRHWSRAKREFFELAALDRHFARYPVEGSG